MYQYKNRVSYSQMDVRGKLGISHIVDVMQDACMFHCEEVGRSCMELKKEKRAWLVSSWHVQFKNLPGMGEEYTVSTWPYQMKGVFNCQNVVLKSMDGEVFACGDSTWFFYDHEKNKPLRIPEEEKANYTIEPAYEMAHAPRKLVCPDDLVMNSKITVCPNYLDTNIHMNNGQYVRLSLNVLPDEFEVGELRAEFRNAARKGDVLYVYTKKTDMSFFVVFMNESQTPYFLAEFCRKS